MRREEKACYASESTPYGRGTMQARVQRTRSAQDLLDENRRFYDLLWSGARLVEPSGSIPGRSYAPCCPNPVDGSRLRPA